MTKRRFNWRPGIVLLISLLVLGVTTWQLRNWQRNRMAYSALNKGLKAFENHLWKDAAENLGIYLTADPVDIEILHKYARAQLNIRPLKEDNVHQAIATYRHVLRIDKNNTDAARNLIGLYLQIKVPAEAELIAVRYLQKNQDVQIDTMLAVALAEQRKFKKSAKKLEKIIDANPQQIGTYEILGKLTEQYSENFLINPENWFNKAVTKNPDSAYAYIIRAAYYLRKNQIKKAVADLNHAEKLDLSEINTRFRLVNEFTKANMLQKAEIHLNKIQTINPKNNRLWQARAKLALKTNSKQNMAKVAQSGLKELQPDVWDFMPAATELFIKSGKFELAKECIQKLQRRDIRPAAVACLRGLLAESLEKNHKAIMCWRQAEQLGGKSEKVQLKLANAYWFSGDCQSAIFQLRKLVSEKPSSFKGHFELARRLAQMGKWTDVEQNARLASTIAPNNIGAALLVLRAQIQLIQQGRPEQIQLIYKKMRSKLKKLDNIPENKTEVNLLKCQLAIKLRQFHDAEQMITELRDAHDKKVEIGIAEVDLKLAQNQTNQAITKLYSLMDQFPQDAMPVKYLASLLVDHGSRADCEKLLKQKIQQIQNNFAKRDLGILLDNLYARWEQKEKACEMLTELAKQLPYDIPLKRQLLQNARAKKDKKWAQEIVNQIKAIEGEQGWQWRYEQAKIWFEEKNFDNFYPRIVALLKKNLSANPEDQTSRILLAKVFQKAGDLKLAVTTYREALNQAPHDINVIVSTIAAMYKAKEYEKADEILNRISTQKLTNPQISKLQLQNCLRQGKLDSAEVILEELKTQNPGNENLNLSLALVKIRQGKFEQAREMLQELKTRNPKSFPISAALIELNIRQKNNDQAINLCNELVKEQGNASAHILRAKTYLILGKNESAKKDFDKAVVIDPDNTQAWICKSEYERSIGQIEDAVKAIENALEVEPDNLQIQKRTIALLLSSRQADKIKKGAEILNAALFENPSDIELKLFKAQYLLSKAILPAIRQAQKILKKITIKNPKIAQAWVLWSKSYLMQAQNGKAMYAILSGLKHSPSDKSLLLLKARTEAIHKPKLAIPTLQQLFDTEPRDIEVALELAKIYIAANQYDKGIDLLQDILVNCQKKDRIKIDTQLAVARYRNGEKERAMQEFDLLYQSNTNDPNILMAETSLLLDEERMDLFFARVNDWLRKNPNDTTTLLKIAKKLAKTKKDKYLQTAETLLRKILDRRPNCLKTMKSLAMLLQITERTENAEKIYRKILTQEPDDAIALNNLAWIMCEKKGDYRSALQLAQKGLTKMPQYVDLIDTRGVIYYRVGKIREALHDFSKCIELYPKNSPELTISHFHLARTLAALGQNHKAVDNLKKTLEFNSRLGGLSPPEINETEHLLKKLLKEQNYESVTR